MSGRKTSMAEDGLDLFRPEASEAKPAGGAGGAEQAQSQESPPPPARSPHAAREWAHGRGLVFTETEAAAVSYEVVDRVIAEGRAEIAKIETMRNNMLAHLSAREMRPISLHTGGLPNRTRGWWCTRLLGELERLGSARLNIRFSHHAYRSLLAADWIWDRFAESGVDFDVE